MNAISPAVQTVLDLFATDLHDVRFGDVDANLLAQLASEVATASDAADAAQAALDTHRASLVERQDVLLQHAQRALSYARVYAESDAVLSARLEAVILPRATRKTRTELNTPANETLVLTPGGDAPRRRAGRPKKAPASGPNLALAEPELSLVVSPEPFEAVGE
jgi:hypothetical protein